MAAVASTHSSRLSTSRVHRGGGLCNHRGPSRPAALPLVDLSFLPWNGCDQGGNYSTGRTRAEGCQEIYQPAAAAEARFSERMRQLRAQRSALTSTAESPVTLDAYNSSQAATSAADTTILPPPNLPAPDLTEDKSAIKPVSLQGLSPAFFGAGQGIGIPSQVSQALADALQGRLLATAAGSQSQTPAAGGQPAQQSTSLSSPPSSGSSQAADEGAAAAAGQGVATPPAERKLSAEARRFLRDELDAELRARNKELADAAWMSLE